MPELRSRVVDRAGVLSPQTKRSLEQSLEQFEARTGHQIVVHVTPSLEGLTIEEYSLRIAEAWKIGQKGLDNGVILTVAPNERELRIEVGYGLEGVLPDAVGARIIREQITPEFRAGNLEGGILAGVSAIEAAAQGEQLPLPKRSPRDDFDTVAFWFKVFWILLILGIFVARTPLLWMLLGVPGSPRYRRYGGGGWGGGGFGGGGGGFGGGGFSGGGGSFGGGGASGRW